jgi:hypothetical protein
MKIMNELKKFGSKCVEVVKNTSRSIKTLVVGAGAALSATASKAAVTFDGTTQQFSGIFDLGPFYSAVGIVITAIAVVAAIGLAIRQFRKVG